MASQQKRIRETLLALALQPRNLAKALGHTMAGQASQSVTILTLDGQWLKVLQTEGPPENRRIAKLLACPVAGSSPEEVLKAFNAACATEGLVPREALAAIPIHLCTVRLFSLPSTDPKEIRDIVDLQAEKHTPYAKEEILTDFLVLDREASGYSRVLLVISHQDVVHRSVQLVEMAGLALERVGSELEGLINWFRLAKRDAGRSGATLLVDVDAAATTVLLLVRGQLRFHRSVPLGAVQLEEDPVRASERLVGELGRSMEAVEVESGAGKLQEIVLTGRIERLTELKAQIEGGLNIPVSPIPSLSVRDVPQPVRAAYEQLSAISVTALVGLALGPSRLDLTPHAAKLRQAFESRARALVLLACQGVAAMILLSLLVIGRANKEQRYYQQLGRVYTQSTEASLQLEQALVQVELVKDRLRHRGELLGAMDTLARLSPPEITWKSLTFTGGEGLVLKGSSEALPKVYEFVAGLDNDPMFGQVQARRVLKRKDEEGKDINDFEIVCPFASAAAETGA